MTGSVYAIASGDFVKIGYSSDARRPLSKIETCRPRRKRARAFKERAP